MSEMAVMTTHRTFLGREGGRLIHLTDIDDARLFKVSREHQVEGASLGDGVTVMLSGKGVTLLKDGRFQSAVPGKLELEARTTVDTWETFVFVDRAVVDELLADPSVEDEMRRFRERVAYLRSEGRPVKIYCGSGTVPRPGFINLDIICNAPKFFVENREDYFLFPFANCDWGIPDDSVDYIFHEDFIEHISQCMQWQFFAEALRVMKRGSWHRVNTPNLITSMKRHSDFATGFSGVYTGELEWDHIAILSPFQLKEIAETIGYSEIIFTTRSSGVSPYAEFDYRPVADRDEVGGNIYADLRK